MSHLSGVVSRPILIVVGLGYLALLAAGLVWMHLDPGLVLALTVGGAGLVLLVLRPYLGILAFMLLLYVENVLPTEEGVTAMKAAGVVILIGWILSLGVRKGAGLRIDTFTSVMVLFVAWACVSLYYAVDPSAGVVRVLTFMQLVLATLMFSSVVDSLGRLRGIYWTIICCTWVFTIIAIVMYYMGLTRVAVGLSVNRNSLAGEINIAIVCAYLLYQVTRRWPAKLFLVSTLPVYFFGMALTLSRTGLVVMLLVLVVIWYRVAKQRSIPILLGSIGVVCVVIFVPPDVFWERASTIVPAVQRQEDTFGTRVRLWQMGLRMVEDHPVTGVGPDNFVVATPRYARGTMLKKRLVAHSSYVSVASEMGLPALALFLLLHWIALRGAHFASVVGARQDLPDLRALAIVTEMCLIVMMLGALTASCEATKDLWVFFGLATRLGRMALEAAPRESPAAARLSEAPAG